MRPVVVFEDDGFEDLLPLVFWRSIPELRLGRKIILDRVSRHLNVPIAGVWVRDWMARVAAQRCGAPANQPIREPTILVNCRWLFDGPVQFPDDACLGLTGDGEVAYVVCDQKRGAAMTPGTLRAADLGGLPERRAPGRLFRYPWDLVADLPGHLRAEWSPDDAIVLSKLDAGLKLDPTDRIHIGERVRIHPTASLDTEDGPVFLSDDVVVSPYAVIEGPTYLGPGTRVSPHAWLHGGNAIGPVCKVGGEVCGCIMAGYSNKQHHGFLGHSYVGSWVNIGAGATNSNLKNTYGAVRVPINGREIDTRQQFFGSILADYAKVGINAAIPTGCVIGFAASIAATGPIAKYVPSFSWVTAEGVGQGDPLRALDVATAVMARRSIDMTDEEIELFLELGQRVQQFEAPLAKTAEHHLAPD